MNLENLLVLAQNGDDAAAAAAAGAAIIILLVELVLIGIMIVGLWTTFTKAGKPGWAAIIPIYNVIILLEIAGKPLWWIVLCLLPCVNVIAMLLISIDVAKSFRKGAGFGVGLAFLPFIFYPILGFGSAKYQGPAAAEA
jgi:hypothetical protein